jgi:hypothetical protein
MTLFKFNQILIYSSFASIFINPVIHSYFINAGLGNVWGGDKGLAWLAWLLITIAGVGVKVKVGLEQGSQTRGPHVARQMCLCGPRHHKSN